MLRLRTVLVVAVLAGLSVSGWMRQCCAAGCAEREVRQVKAEGCACCRKATPKPKVEKCCPFGKSCRDEAEREKCNPSPTGESRAAPQDVAPPPAAADFVILPLTDGPFLPPAVCLLPVETLGPLDVSSCLRN